MVTQRHISKSIMAIILFEYTNWRIANAKECIGFSGAAI
jgi:hypothetical protein